MNDSHFITIHFLMHTHSKPLQPRATSDRIVHDLVVHCCLMLRYVLLCILNDLCDSQDKVYCLSIDAKLDENTMADIMAAGHSRVLVFDGQDCRNIRGYLQVRHTQRGI